jgi:two-component system chemotaxis response regulator CheY
MGLILRAENFSIVEAQHGAEALRILQDCPQLPDVVLLDLDMPVMGGEPLLRVLAHQPRFERLKIVLVSSRPEAALPLDVLQPAARIAKPFTPAGLVHVVRRLLAVDPRSDARASEAASQPNTRIITT